MPVVLHTTADQVAIQHVEGGKQRGGAMPDVVVGHGAATPLLHGQAWLGAVECLDLARFIDPVLCSNHTKLHLALAVTHPT